MSHIISANVIEAIEDAVQISRLDDLAYQDQARRW